MRFDVRVNGKKVCRAAVKGFGVLNVIVNCAKRDPAAFDDDAEMSRDEWARPQVALHVGGWEAKTDKQFIWDRRELQVGDEVTVRVLK